MIEILSWAVFGLLAGGIAKLLMPGKDPGGCLVTMLIGFAGAMIGGFVGRAFGWRGVTAPDMRSLGVAVFGAVLLLIAYRMVFRADAARREGAPRGDGD